MWTLRAAREKEAAGTRAARAAERAMVVSMDIVNGEGEEDDGDGRRAYSSALKSTSSCRHVGLLRLDDEPHWPLASCIGKGRVGVVGFKRSHPKLLSQLCGSMIIAMTCAAAYVTC